MYSLDETAPTRAGTSRNPPETYPGVVPDAEKEQFPQSPIVGGIVLKGNLYIFQTELDKCSPFDHTTNQQTGTHQLYEYASNPQLSRDQLAEITLFLISLTELPTSGNGRGGDLQTQLLTEIAKHFTKNVLEKIALKSGEPSQQVHMVALHEALVQAGSNPTPEFIRPTIKLTQHDIYQYAYNLLRDNVLKKPKQVALCKEFVRCILNTIEAARRVALQPEVLQDLEQRQRLNALAPTFLFDELCALKTDKLRNEATLSFRIINWFKNNI